MDSTTTTPQCTTDVGDLVVGWVVGDLLMYIGEIIEKGSPLVVKVEEEGPYARLKVGEDFIIIHANTADLQADVRDDTNHFLNERYTDDRKIASGLKRLGVTDGTLRYIFPNPLPEKVLS